MAEKWYNVKNVTALRRMLRDLMKMESEGKLIVDKSVKSAGQASFNMRILRRHKGILRRASRTNIATFEEATECGTTACAAGWADLRVLPMRQTEHLHEYATRLIADKNHPVSWWLQFLISEWLFDMTWARVAPGPDAVLIRLNWLIENGLDELSNKHNQYFGKDNWLHRFWKTEFVNR